VFFKAVWVAVVMVATTSIVKANNSYVTNDVMNGQQVETRFVYQKNNQTLSYYMKYHFTYDQENRLASKETFRWNNNTQEWEPQSRVDYTYEEGEIVMENNVWDKKEKRYREMAQLSFQYINSTEMYVAQTSKK
ncbi:MAG: DUF3836 domain-containing protein, partial [Bacteroides sp.]|nr:DUF3836 domain-containing protein [Bacteroides sp.]